MPVGVQECAATPTARSLATHCTAGPGLSYQIGKLKILDLRNRARIKLGSRFDLKAFHDELLGGGSLPLDMLESRIEK